MKRGRGRGSISTPYIVWEDDSIEKQVEGGSFLVIKSTVKYLLTNYVCTLRYLHKQANVLYIALNLFGLLFHSLKKIHN